MNSKKLVKIFLVLLVIANISGCTFQHLEEGLASFKGKHISAVVDTIGVPDDKKVIDGRHIYIWRSSSNHTFYTPVSTSTHGTINNSFYTGYSTSSIAQTKRLSCEIKLITDKSKIVRSAEYYGNRGECFYYAKPLYKHAKETRQNIDKEEK